MVLYAKHIGGHGCFPADVIELIVTSGNTSISETVTSLSTNKVDEDFISSLRGLADELQEHNDKIKKLDNPVVISN